MFKTVITRSPNKRMCEVFKSNSHLEFYKKVEGDLMVYEEKPITYLDSDQAKTIENLSLDLKNQIKGFEILSNRITELEKKKEFMFKE